MRDAVRVAALALACALAAACSKKAEKAAPPPPPDRPPVMTVEELTRNSDACKDYVAKVCACATAHPDKPDVAELCKTDAALPAALDVVSQLAGDSDTSKDDVRLAQSKARKIAKACMDGVAKLASLGCE